MLSPLVRRHIRRVTRAGIGDADHAIKGQLRPARELPLKLGVAAGSGAPRAVGYIVVAGVPDIALAG